MYKRFQDHVHNFTEVCASRKNSMMVPLQSYFIAWLQKQNVYCGFAGPYETNWRYEVDAMTAKEFMSAVC